MFLLKTNTMHFDTRTVFLMILFITTLGEIAGRRTPKNSARTRFPQVLNIDLDRLSEDELRYLYHQLSSGTKALPISVRDTNRRGYESGKRRSSGGHVLRETDDVPESTDNAPKESGDDDEEESEDVESDNSQTKAESESEETAQAPLSEKGVHKENENVGGSGEANTENTNPSPPSQTEEVSKSRKKKPWKFQIQTSEKVEAAGPSANASAKFDEKEFNDSFDMAIDQAMGNMLKEMNDGAQKDQKTSTSETNENIATVSDNNYTIIQRVTNPKGKKRRIRKLMYELKRLCGIHLSMCIVIPRKTLPYAAVGNQAANRVNQESTPGAASQSTASSKANMTGDSEIKKLLLLELNRLKDLEQKITMKKAKTAKIDTAEKQQSTTAPGLFHQLLDRPTSQEPQSESAKQPGGNPYLGDQAVWIGICVGAGISWLLILLMYGCYRCLLHYRSERQNEQLQRLCNRQAHDENQMHITMSKMAQNKNGNHYVVSMNDKNEEDGWSSEEEVFNVSGAREPSTSTPVGTPVKKQTGLK